MKEKIKSANICVCLCSLAVLFFLSLASAHAQANAKDSLLKRTTYKTDSFDFGAGGTVSIVGAPVGSIRVEGWRRNSVEISADVEVQAPSEADLTLLAQVNTFTVDQDFGHIRVLTFGAYDKTYMKRVGKKFPKHLLAMPFRVDYRIKVPVFCDVEIDGGRGDLALSNVEGVIQIKVLESNARLDLIGGTLLATIGGGSADITIPTSNWRGRNVDVQMAKGEMRVRLAPNLNANVDASILRTGQIENAFEFLKPRAPRVKFTDKLISAKSGNGGASLSFTVGDGTLKLARIEN